MKETYSQPGRTENKKTPRQMWAELARLFHNDADLRNKDNAESHKLMLKVNAAYEKAKEKNDSSELEAMYKEWAGGGGGEKRIEKDLERFSNELFDAIRRGREKRLFAEAKIRQEYRKLCDESGVKSDIDFLNKFMLNQGWITREDFETVGQRVDTYA